MRVDDRVVLVTGSVTGIGKAIARRVRAAGGRPVVHGPDPDAARAAAAELGAAAWVAGDLADPDIPARLIAETVAVCGAIHGLVNNAASTARSTLETTDAAFFDRMIAVNVRAPLLLIRAALPHFRAQGGGKVVNIGSTNAHCGERGLLAYAVSKGALLTMTRNLADAHGAEGIRINQINPGWTLTENEYAIKVQDGLPEDWPSRLPKNAAPSGGLLTPDDIAAQVVFFLSDEAPRVSGTVMDFEQYPVIGRNPPKETA